MDYIFNLYHTIIDFFLIIIYFFTSLGNFISNLISYLRIILSFFNLIFKNLNFNPIITEQNNFSFSNIFFAFKNFLGLDLYFVLIFFLVLVIIKKIIKLF